LTFSNSSSAVIFPGSTANYGTGSFTVEMAFKPDYIEGKHYLMSKNSGSFPNWAIYLSGSSGQGKLWSEFNINASVSCSVSSSTTFVTGSVYQVDVRIASAFSASSIYVNGLPENLGLGNNGGSLTNTGSLLVGNFSQNNTQNFSGSIYTIKTYLQASTLQPVVNFNATSTRFSKPPIPETGKKRFEVLIVAGGGGAQGYRIGGGGAGGLQTLVLDNINSGNNTVVVGNGSTTTGQNSSFLSYISIGGGGSSTSNGGNGGSGGGARSTGTPGTGIPGQGNAGSNSSGWGGGNDSGAGGGAGSAAFQNTAGAGLYVSTFQAIGGLPAGYFAGGGAAGRGDTPTVYQGGIGGGGNTFQTGSRNTGGGGGSTGNTSLSISGGSGIVAIRYSGGPIAVGGEITQSAGFTYHVFRTVGTSSFTIF
jgi:hypothetical protein